MTNEELDRLEALANAATPGPWAVRPLRYDDWGWVRAVGEEHDNALVAKAMAGRDYNSVQHRAEMTDPYAHNAAFIAAARDAVPALVKTVHKRDAEIARLRALVKEAFAEGNSCGWEGRETIEDYWQESAARRALDA